ncbi:ATP-binding protein [Halobellus sp. GM3]|uniref:ATP-binding protein n=1 Tax=Halobellus sp. GM3 TaxID=3458410 RepID=UPI00403D647E
MTASGHKSVDDRAVLRSLREPVVALDPDGSVAFANRRFLDVTRSERADVLGSDRERLAEYVESSDGDLRAAIDAVADGRSEEERCDCVIRHPESAPVPRRLPAEVRITPLDSEGEGDAHANGGVVLVLRDVSERARYERTLERRNARLDEFAGVISHDLRNPLNVATGRLELLADRVESEHLAAARAALDRMDELIEDLLALARHGEDVGETSAVDLGRAASRCWRTIETGDARLVVDAADARIRADESRLRQLLSNLLQNAVTHGGPDVTVTVGATDEGFYVADDGAGLPAGERERILEPGYTLAEDGTGLGLNIVRTVAEAHGWDLRVADSADGGARFELGNVDRLGP